MKRRQFSLLAVVLLALAALSGGIRQTPLPLLAQTAPPSPPRRWTRPPAEPAPAPVLPPIDLLAGSTVSVPPVATPMPANSNRAGSTPLPAGRFSVRAVPADLPFPSCIGVSLGPGQSASCTLNEGKWNWAVTINDSTCQGNDSATITWPDGTADTLSGFGQCGGTVDSPFHTLSTGGANGADEGNTGTLTVHYIEPSVSPPPQDSVWTITIVEGDLLTPQITQINPQEGQQFTQVIANFTNTGPAQPQTPGSDFTATIDWGDGSPAEMGVTVNGGAGGPYTVQGTHTYMDEGPEPNGAGGGNYLVHVTISDPGNKPPVGDAEFPVTVQEMDNITWTGNPMTISATEGQPIDTVLATFSDAYTQQDPADFTAQITWTNTADGTATTSQGTVTGSGGTFQITGADPSTGEGFIPKDEGVYDLQITLSDNAPGGLLGGTPATAIVEEGDGLSVLGFPFSSAKEGTAVDGTIAVFGDTNHENTAADFTALIDWGDGTMEGKGVDYDEASGQISVDGHHAYADEGVYNVSVTVLDDVPGDAKATATGFITVSEGDQLSAGSPVTISAAAGAAFQGQIADVLDSGYQTADEFFKPNDPKDFRATIDWGDHTSQSTGTVSIHAPAPSQTQTQYDISGSHTYRSPGSYKVNVTLSDDKPGPNPIALATVTVTNAATVSGTGGSCKQGDVNCDGTVNATDANCELAILAGAPTNPPSCPIPPPGNADVNGDGVVNHVDVLCIDRIIAGAPSTPACPIFGSSGQPAGPHSGPLSAPEGDLVPPALVTEVTGVTEVTDGRGSGGGQTRFQVEVDGSRITDHGSGRLGAWTIDLTYDPRQVHVGGCIATAGICDAAYAPGVIRIVGASFPGLSGKQILATIRISSVGSGAGSALQIGSAALVDPEGATLGAIGPTGMSGSGSAGGEGN